MADTFPKDEFDAAPVHGGRHRIRRTAKHRILEFFKIASFSALVALVGYVGLKGIDSLNFFNDSATVNTQPVVAVQESLVVVLDGTNRISHQVGDHAFERGLQRGNSCELRASNWRPGGNHIGFHSL